LNKRKAKGRLTLLRQHGVSDIKLDKKYLDGQNITIFNNLGLRGGHADGEIADLLHVVFKRNNK